MRNSLPHSTLWPILRGRPIEVIKIKDHLINSFRFDSRLRKTSQRLSPRLRDTKAHRGQAPEGFNWASEMLEVLVLGEEMDGSESRGRSP